MKVLFIVCTCKTYSFSNIYIDRPDLTRKLSCLETWVPRVVEKGYDVLFYSGDSETEYYDEQHKHLYLTENDSYDYGEEGKPSFHYERIKAAVKWCRNNKEFDYIFSITDSDYINIDCLTEDVLQKMSNYDFLSNGSGGEGMVFNQKTAEIFVNDPYVNKFRHSDIALDNLFRNELREKYQIRFGGLDSVGLKSIRCYILGEKNFLTHYCNGKRMYWADFILSSYNNSTPLKRKIVYNLPINAYQDSEVHTYETINKSNTPLFYSYTTDKNGWEHFGSYTRSDVNTNFIFGKNSIYNGFFIDYHLLSSFGSEINNILLNQILPSIQEGGYLIFYYEKYFCENYEILKNALIENNINFTIELNLLEHINVEDRLIKESEYSFNNEFIKITNG
jgi:hypothetical protein